MIYVLSISYETNYLRIHFIVLTTFVSQESKFLVYLIKCYKNDNYGWWFGFYGISTFVGYLMPNSFLYK